MRSLIAAGMILLSYNCFTMSNSVDSTKIKYTFGITPSAVINVTPAIQLSHDISFSKYFSFGLETGFLFSHININNLNTRGFRLRPQLKVTVFDNNNFSVDFYGFYNYRYFEAKMVQEVVKAEGAYIEEVHGTRKTSLKGFGVGVDLGFSEVDNFLKKINIGIGLGRGNINNEYSDQIFEPFSFFRFNQSGKIEIPMIFLHLNMHIF
jgi:hypothetical protein